MPLTNAPRGTNDFLPEDSGVLKHIEEALRRVSGAYGFGEIRTPIFEHTELFQRGIGDGTDVVEKEMYTFTDRGDRSLTLRPEGTASVVRAYLEHKMHALAQPVKLLYSGPMFRYERPQAGRYRQFHQLGLESIGSQDPMVDAEIIAVCTAFYKELGLAGYTLNLNSIGCPDCRPAYLDALREFSRENLGNLCGTCQSRYEKNTLRLLDCKVDACRTITEGAPKNLDHLCEGCRTHYDGLTGYLKALGIDYDENPRLVRGLDYYTKTVFEFTLPGIGSQDAIGGGGRYDGLVHELGGDPTPGVGVAFGLERIMIALRSTGAGIPGIPNPLVYIVRMGERAKEAGFGLAYRLRDAGIRTDLDYMGKGMKGQLKSADKSGARYCIVMGDNELDKGVVAIKDMVDGGQREIPFDGIVDELRK